MNAQPLFRELVYIDHLKQGGIEERQARAMAEALNLALSEAVATKADIAELKTDIEKLETRMTADLKTSIADARTSILQWMFGTQIALAAFLFAVLKLVH